MATFKATFAETNTLTADFTNSEELDLLFGESSKVETGDYEKLSNKPKINGHTVIGDKRGKDYNLQDKMEAVAESEIDAIIYGG